MITALAVTPDGRLVFYATDKRDVRCMDLEKGLDVPLLEENNSTITALCTNGTVTISGYDNGQMSVWDIDTGTELRTFNAHRGRITCIKMNDVYIYSSSLDSRIRIWKADTGKCLHTLRAHTDAVTSMALTPTYLLSVSLDATVRLWDQGTGQLLHRVTPSRYWLTDISVTQDGKHAVIGNTSNNAFVLDIEKLKITDLPKHTSCVDVVVAHGNSFVTASWDKTVFGGGTKKRITSLVTHMVSVGKLLVVAHMDGTIQLSPGMLHVNF